MTMNIPGDPEDDPEGGCHCGENCDREPCDPCPLDSHEACVAGMDAHKNGKDLYDNPFPTSDPLHGEWSRGYLERKEDQMKGPL